jgi:type VI secretion system protein ImpK
MTALIDSGQDGAAQLIDSLLQPSILLVVELQLGAAPLDGPALWARCVKQVELLREQLKLAGLGAQPIEAISHVQCALLDESLLEHEQGEAYAVWARESLQARFFNHHQAGERVYEQLDLVLRETTPDAHVLTAFQRVLSLGFKGRYQTLDHPERQRVLAALNARLAPLGTSEPLPTLSAKHQRGSRSRQMPSLLTHGLAIGGLLTLLWWGLDALLIDAIAQLPGQG